MAEGSKKRGTPEGSVMNSEIEKLTAKFEQLITTLNYYDGLFPHYVGLSKSEMEQLRELLTSAFELYETLLPVVDEDGKAQLRTLRRGVLAERLKRFNAAASAAGVPPLAAGAAAPETLVLQDDADPAELMEEYMTKMRWLQEANHTFTRIGRRKYTQS